MSERAKSAYGDGREALLAAVVEIVGEFGLAGMSYRKVAARAGVANTLITHHFGTREVLLEAALVWATERTLDLVDMAAEGTYGKAFARNFVSMIDAHPHLQFFQYEMLLAARQQSELRIGIEGLYDRYMMVMGQGFARRGFEQPELLARVIFAATDGLVMQQLSFGKKAEIERSFILLGEMLEAMPRVATKR